MTVDIEPGWMLTLKKDSAGDGVEGVSGGVMEGLEGDGMDGREGGIC